MFFRYAMITRGCCFLATLLVGIPVTAWQANSGQVAEPVQQWLQDLESDTYAARQAASRNLAEAGIAVVQPLVERLLLGPPETSASCTRLLSQIALNADQQDMTRIARILLLLSQNGMDHLRRESLILNGRWKQAQLDRTVERLAKAGIEVSALGDFGRMVGGPEMLIPASEFLENQHAQVGPPPAGSDSAAQTADEIMLQVEQIIQATEEENNQRFAAEMVELRPAADLQDAGTQQDILGSEVVILGGEARVVVRGAGRLIVDGRAMGVGGTPFLVTIGKDFEGSSKDLDLLKLLPAITQVTIRERTIDAAVLEMLRSNASIQYATLESCQYDLTSMFALLENRPDLTVSAIGHDAFLGVQLQTDQSGDGDGICRVVDVVADTAAKEAGIQTDDVIRKVNGVSVRSYEQVILAIGSFKAGDVLQLDIVRGESEELQVQAKLRSRPADQ